MKTITRIFSPRYRLKKNLLLLSKIFVLSWCLISSTKSVAKPFCENEIPTESIAQDDAETLKYFDRLGACWTVVNREDAQFGKISLFVFSKLPSEGVAGASYNGHADFSFMDVPEIRKSLQEIVDSDDGLFMYCPQCFAVAFVGGPGLGPDNYINQIRASLPTSRDELKYTLAIGAQLPTLAQIEYGIINRVNSVISHELNHVNEVKTGFAMNRKLRLKKVRSQVAEIFSKVENGRDLLTPTEKIDLKNLLNFSSLAARELPSIKVQMESESKGNAKDLYEYAQSEYALTVGMAYSLDQFNLNATPIAENNKNSKVFRHAAREICTTLLLNLRDSGLSDSEITRLFPGCLAWE